MLLETIGIGMILPILNIIASPESLKQYDWVNDFFVLINIIEAQQIIYFL